MVDIDDTLRMGIVIIMVGVLICFISVSNMDVLGLVWGSLVLLIGIVTVVIAYAMMELKQCKSAVEI